jgi:hypothetical protein
MAAGLLMLPAGQSLAEPADEPQAEQALEVPAPQPVTRAPPSAGEPAKPHIDAAPEPLPAAGGGATGTGREPGSTPPAARAADDIAEIFSKVGDQIYEDCIFELSQEQVDVQAALIDAYVQQGASSATARRLAVKQIQPPPLSKECEEVRRSPEALPPASWETTLAVPKETPVPAAPKPMPAAKPKPPPAQPPPAIVLAGKKMLPQWDCAPGVDYVTINLNGYQRKLTGGEICNPYEDVVREVPASLTSFRLGYTIKTGRLFIDDAQGGGRTIAWGLSGRDICRNNPDPDCFAAKAIGPLPPGEYAFATEQKQRVSWGPRTKRLVAGIYLRKLWNKEHFNPSQKAAVLARGNIAIHVRLKGEMSEACIGLEPKGWTYVAGLIKEGRTTGVNVYIDEPYPQVAEAPPVVVASTFSLTSLFNP